VPSAVTYDVSDPCKLINWGFAAIRRQVHGDGRRVSEPFTRFRTLLQEPKNMPESDAAELRTLNRLCEAYGKDAKDITVDYLRCIWNYAIEQLKLHLGDFQEKYAIRVVLTIPAVWTPSTIKMIKALAIRAGLPTDTDFLPESEAFVVASVKIPTARAKLGGGYFVTVCYADVEECVRYIFHPKK